HLGQLALLSPLEAWSSRIDLAGATAEIGSPKIRRKIEKRRAAVLWGATERLENQGQAATGAPFEPSRAARPPGFRVLCRDTAGGSAGPATALPSSRRRVQDRRGRQRRHILCHRALRIGRRCAPMLLQIKEAQQSVLEAFAGASASQSWGTCN